MPPDVAPFRQEFDTAASLRDLRRDLGAWLSAIGVSDRANHDVILAVSEAATNAIEHGYRDRTEGRVIVDASCSDGSVVVSVQDFGQWRNPTADANRGRGVPIMQAIARSYHRDSTNIGTVVTMHIPVSE